MTNWYCKVSDSVIGPFPGEKIEQMIADGQIGPGAYVRAENATGWILVSAFHLRVIAPQDHELIATAPPSVPPSPPVPLQQERLWWLSAPQPMNVGTGPHNHSVIIDLLRAGQLSKASLICEVGAAKWQPLHEWCETFMGRSNVANIAMQETRRPDGQKATNLVAKTCLYAAAACFGLARGVKNGQVPWLAEYQNVLECASVGLLALWLCYLILYALSKWHTPRERQS